MANRIQSAKERTGLFLLAAVLAGLGGTAVAAEQHHKGTAAKPKKKVTAVAESKKKAQGGRKAQKSRKKVTTAARHQKKSAAGTVVASALPAPSDPKPEFQRQAPAAASPAPQAAPATPAPSPAQAASPASSPTVAQLAAAVAAGNNLPFGQEDPIRPDLSKDYVPSDLVRVAPEYVFEAGKEILLRQEAFDSLQAMIREAASQGLTLKVVSGYRDYAYQNRLYQSALRRYGKGQRMVGRPGRSEHFLGTTVDVSNKNAGQLLDPDFAKSAEYRWLEANAPKYGWKFTVRAGRNGRKASQDEPWHIRYMGGPEAQTALASAAKTSAPTQAAATATAPAPAASAGESVILARAQEIVQRVGQFFKSEKPAPAGKTQETAQAKEKPSTVEGAG